MTFLIAKGCYALLEWLYKVEKPFERIGLKWFWYETTNKVYGICKWALAN